MRSREEISPWSASLRCEACDDYLTTWKISVSRRDWDLKDLLNHHQDRKYPVRIWSRCDCSRKSTILKVDVGSEQLDEVLCSCPTTDQPFEGFGVQVKDHKMIRSGSTFQCEHCKRRLKLIRADFSY